MSMTGHGNPGEAAGAPSSVAMAAGNVKLAWFLALNDLRFRYSRSFIGPLWIALQMAVFVVMLGVVLAEVHGAPVRSFMPFFAVSLMFWTFLNTSINESMESLHGGADLIKDRGVRPIVPVLQAVLRNLLIALHCLPVPVAVILVFGAASPMGLLMALPGVLLFILFTALVSISVAGLGVRFRDLRRIVETAMMLGFLATPILWQPGVLRGKGSLVLALNPFAHLFAVWRDPLLEGHWPAASFVVVVGMVVIAGIAARFAARGLARAAFWL